MKPGGQAGHHARVQCGCWDRWGGTWWVPRVWGTGVGRYLVGHRGTGPGVVFYPERWYFTEKKGFYGFYSVIPRKEGILRVLFGNSSKCGIFTRKCGILPGTVQYSGPVAVQWGQ